jgi:hypothetical protein
MDKAKVDSTFSTYLPPRVPLSLALYRVRPNPSRPAVTSRHSYQPPQDPLRPPSEAPCSPLHPCKRNRVESPWIAATGQLLRSRRLPHRRLLRRWATVRFAVTSPALLGDAAPWEVLVGPSPLPYHARTIEMVAPSLGLARRGPSLTISWWRRHQVIHHGHAHKKTRMLAHPPACKSVMAELIWELEAPMTSCWRQPTIFL